MNPDELNESIQGRLYALIDSKANGLADCTITEITDAIAAAIAALAQGQSDTKGDGHE